MPNLKFKISYFARALGSPSINTFFYAVVFVSGIYIHIPYCKQACSYCNFHFSTSLKTKEGMLNALIKEVQLRRSELQVPIDTVYLGGGTPSLFTGKELQRLLNEIWALSPARQLKEFTLEANPDDITSDKLKHWQDLGINRLSIGVQSFFQEDLAWMNRAHTEKEAHQCLEKALNAGFKQLTIDLIYGYPLLSDDKLQYNLEQLRQYELKHFSAYGLTVEPKTALDHAIKKGSTKSVNEEQAANQFLLLMQTAEQMGFDHYEISNFAQPDHYAVHNTSYWKGEGYIGLGPSAHSYNGKARFWNKANNKGYIKSLQQGILPQEREDLNDADRFNEYIMTGLRTKWGIDLQYLEDNFPAIFMEELPQLIEKLIDRGLVLKKENCIVLSKQGKLLADSIMSDLFYSE